MTAWLSPVDPFIPVARRINSVFHILSLIFNAFSPLIPCSPKPLSPCKQRLILRPNRGCLRTTCFPSNPGTMKVKRNSAACPMTCLTFPHHVSIPEFELDGVRVWGTHFERDVCADYQSDSDSFNPALWEEQRQQRMTVAFDFEDKKEEEDNSAKVKVPYTSFVSRCFCRYTHNGVLNIKYSLTKSTTVLFIGTLRFDIRNTF